MGTLLQDLRYGARMLFKNPSFTVIAVFALALGVGANTAIFSIVNASLLRPLPYPNAARLVAVQELNDKSSRIQSTPANFLDWRKQSQSFAHLAAIFARTANLASGDEAERVDLAVTSADFFEVFGVQPLRGRFFMPQEEVAGHEPVIVIGYGLWQRRFGGEAGIVGKSITLDGRNYTVIGVAPADFRYPDKTEAWIPPLQLAPSIGSQMDVTQVRGFGFLSVVGLLKPNVTAAQAHEEMNVITARLREQYPETNKLRFNRVVTLQNHLVGDSSRALLLLLGAVALVLLIACANVANLLLARATARQKEIAIRLALGATRRRLIRQLLIESVLLAVIGGAGGLLLGWWGIDLLHSLLPVDFLRAQVTGVDFRVLAFTLLVSLGTGILFGLAPALQATQPDVNETLKESARGTSGGTRSNRLRSLLIVSEIALSLVLLVGAGLLLRSFLRLQAVELGFNPQRVLTFSLTPSGANFREDAQFYTFFRQIAENIRAVPGVDEVGAVGNALPLGKGATSAFRIEGQPTLPPDQWARINYRSASPGYFRAMGIPLLRGRDISDRDGANAPLAVVINQSVAQRNFPGADPVGKRINMGGTGSDGQPIWLEIVGVVADVRNQQLNEPPEPELYTSSLQDAFATMYFVVRSSVEPESLLPAIREAARQVDKAQPIAEVREMEQIVSESASAPRFQSLLLGIFAIVALLLAAAGIYGVMSYSVAQRTHEIGVRLALGAQRRDVLKLIMAHGARLILLGIGIGLLAALGLSRLLAGLLFGVTATDPATFIGVALFLIGVAMFACYLPARRATKVDPLSALRYE